MDLIQLRQELHRHPELSGKEEETANRIGALLESLSPDQLLTGLGGHGIAATWEGKSAGPHLLIRAELDALPIPDHGKHDHASQVGGVGHLCGHDGHMAILVGLAERIAANPPIRGKVTLLFQPAEETGAGAAAVINDPAFASIKPDTSYALHNLPGYPLGHILLKDGPFACASKGMIIRLHGKTAHAAHPEKAISPALAMAELMERLTDLPTRTDNTEDFVLATVIHAQLGEVAFGTTPGEGVVMATLRSALDSDMERLVERARADAQEVSANHNLRYEIEWVEEFPATMNHSESTARLREALEEAGFTVDRIDKPFRWSEDVGHFGHVGRLTLFGLGSGVDQPPLHAPDFDFPDGLIQKGVDAFEAVLRMETGTV